MLGTYCNIAKVLHSLCLWSFSQIKCNDIIAIANGATVPSYVLEFEQIVVSCYVASLSTDLHGVGIHVVLHQSTGHQAWKYLLQHTLCCSLNCNNDWPVSDYKRLTLEIHFSCRVRSFFNYLSCAWPRKSTAYSGRQFWFCCQWESEREKEREREREREERQDLHHH